MEEKDHGNEKSPRFVEWDNWGIISHHGGQTPPQRRTHVLAFISPPRLIIRNGSVHRRSLRFFSKATSKVSNKQGEQELRSDLEFARETILAACVGEE
jgi:hypothetical protein